MARGSKYVILTRESAQSATVISGCAKVVHPPHVREALRLGLLQRRSPSTLRIVSPLEAALFRLEAYGAKDEVLFSPAPPGPVDAPPPPTRHIHRSRRSIHRAASFCRSVAKAPYPPWAFAAYKVPASTILKVPSYCSAPCSQMTDERRASNRRGRVRKRSGSAESRGVRGDDAHPSR
jgi:hypothetical protein